MRAVIFMLVGLLLTCVAESLPGNLGPAARFAAYAAFGFCLLSGLLSLFEEADDTEVSKLDRTEPPYPAGF